MKTLDRYVAGEMLVPFAVGFAAVLILWIGNIIYQQIPLIVSHLQQWPDVLYYILLQTPGYVTLALPAGPLFGCSLALTRLSRDSEITMMRMAGTSVRRIFLPVFVIAALTSLLAYAFQEQVTTWSARESVHVLQRLMQSPGAPPIQQDVFFRADNYYFYVNSVNRRGKSMELGDVMVYEPPTGRGFPTLTTARSATETNNVWVLNDGIIYKVDNTGNPELVGRFAQMKLDLRHALTDYLFRTPKSPEQMNIRELGEQIALFNKSGLKDQTTSLKLEYGYKLAIPLSSLVLVLCVAPLSLRFGRSGGFMGVLIGVVVLFFFQNVIVFSKLLGAMGALPAMLAGWSEVIIFGLLGLVLLWKVE